MDAAPAKTTEYLRGYLENPLFATQFPVEFLVPWLMTRIRNAYKPGGTLLDLGGGFSVTNAVLSRLGMKVYCADLMSEYFQNSANFRNGMERQFEFLKQEGVTFIQCDLLEYDFGEFEPDSVDVVCSHHVFEHFHHSPKPVCDETMRILKPGGIFFLEIPNALNALKRLKVLLGKTNYLPFDSYFQSDRWLGHIREYCLADVEYLARYCAFSSYRIFGLNYYGTLYPKLRFSLPAVIVDRLLRVFPGACSALYLKGIK